MCTKTEQVVRSIADELEQLSEELFRSWAGLGADAAKAKMAAVVRGRRMQADQHARSSAAFTACDNALVTCQRKAREIVAQAEAAGHALDVPLRGVQIAMDAMAPSAGVVAWGAKKLTGVDLQTEGRKLLLAAVRPVYEEALGLLNRMEAAIRDYEKALLEQAEVLRSMPGIVRKDAGPVDLPAVDSARRADGYPMVDRAVDRWPAQRLDIAICG